MSDQQISYLPYDQALKMVGAIQEEEHPHELNRRIFTVYDINGKEVCWFDAEDTIGRLDLKVMPVLVGCTPNKPSPVLY